MFSHFFSEAVASTISIAVIDGSYWDKSAFVLHNHVTLSLSVSLSSVMKLAQTNYTVAMTVRCFGAFVAEYCCSDSVIVKLICLTVAVTVLFGN